MKHKMSETVYIQINRNVEVSKRTITLGDAAGVYCTDKKIENDIKHICILELKDVGENRRKKERVCMSFLAVVKAVSREYPDIEIVNLGENDFVIDYIYEKKHSKVLQAILIAFVALFTFLGSMYAIMAYNNDVNTIEIFEKVYEIFGAKEAQGAKLLEITYGLGLAVGIMVFYNHFAGKRFGSDPTPIEVEMDKYEKDVDETLIDRSAAVKEEIS